jgi:sec-independent protein translocase protein TatB
MLDFSFSEIVLILVVAFVVFGPERLPEVANKLGKIIGSLRRGFLDFGNEYKKEENDVKPLKEEKANPSLNNE